MATRTYSLKVAAPKPKLRIDYAGLLNEEQLAAVEAPSGPVLVIAGAGSGKTRVLTFRVARMVELGVPLGSILLLTFTNKAAREMTRRVGELLGEIADVRRLLGGTFHHAAHVLLREHAPVLGFSQSFTLLDREDARQLMSECVAEIAPRATSAGGPRELRFPRAEVLVDLASMAVNTQRPLEEVLSARRPQFLPLAPEIGRVVARFAARKAAMNLMDFDDLLENLRRLLADHPPIHKALSERFRCVLVDEYQDTNRLQGEIIDLLVEERRNVTVVGDDAQSIYSFRGADFANIIEFPARYPGCQIFKLTHNYRSTPEILRLANASIALNRRQFTKALRAFRGSGPNPCVVPARDVDEQAAFVAQRMLELRDEGIPLEQMAVLYRAHHHSMELQVELARRGIPFVVRSGVRFFEQAHVKDVLAYLRFLQNASDELAFKRVLRLVPAIGPATADAVWRAVAALSARMSAFEALASPEVQEQVPRKARSGFDKLVELLRRLGAEPLLDSPGAMIDEVLGGGYQEHLQAEYLAAERRAEDIRQLAEYAGRYRGLNEFLNEVTLLSELGTEEVNETSSPDEYVTLSSVHQAKGLEWRAVFVIWLADGRFPLSQVLSDPDEEEEERRLFYVAVTRAKDELYLTYPMTAAMRGDTRVLLQPSRFIAELPAGEEAPYDEWVLEAREG